MKKVSVLIPCHNEEENIGQLYGKLTEISNDCNDYQWEFLFVDDGSDDHTLSIIQQLRTKDQRICYVSLSRNFGKENAILAGIDHVSGDCMIIIDADLQHPPHLMKEMLACWEEGFQDVYAERTVRGKESWLRKHLSLAYYQLLQRLANIDILPNVGDFRLLDRKCINALKQLRETQRYTKGLYCWIGFKKKRILFEQESRINGTSSFNYSKLFNLAIEGITSYSTAPLRISTISGIIVSLAALLYMIYVLFKTIIIGEVVQGYPTLIIVILFLGGIQLFSIGIIGEYLGRIFSETKNRPVYIINEKEGTND